MLKVVETFSGIGAQAAALRNIGEKSEIVGTAEWDVNAILAYDLIHNGTPQKSKYDEMSKNDLLEILSKYTLSMDGKKPATEKQVKSQTREFLARLCAAIDRTHNMLSVTDIKGDDLPNDIDLLTYSFPCQDLSSAGFWHGNKGGIDRNANNRSSMLWQIERILLERYNSNLSMPRFLLMENVTNIISSRHIDNFNEWKSSLNKMGYENYQMILNAKDFGIPQKRKRFYMISIYTNHNVELKRKLDQYFKEHDLQNLDYVKSLHLKKRRIEEILKTDYSNIKYKIEADYSQPKDTRSRLEIWNNNEKLYIDNKINVNIIPTLTTKQDRHPNSGVIEYEKKVGKSSFRYLTPREGFLLMGFEESDFESIINNNFKTKRGSYFFTRDKLNKMAGNSIVVFVLEQIFKQVVYINNLLFNENEEK